MHRQPNTHSAAAAAPAPHPRRADPPALRAALIALACLFLGAVVVLPLLSVLYESLSSGLGGMLAALTHPEALSALRLTVIATLIAVPLNTLFGLAAAWAIAKFDFPGKTALVTIIDAPFSVSPVIAGMAFVLLFGARGWFAQPLSDLGVQIIFALPGIVIATTFVTLPFVARELIPLMQAQSREDEEAALSLGASGWQTFLRVTLPNIRWGLLYGATLCAARAMGEFGAVSVVSGHVRGRTDTLSLHVEALYGDFQFGAASSVAMLLIVLTVLLVCAKNLIARRASAARLQDA